MVANNSEQTEQNRCACSRYSVLVNVREAGDGDLVWDEELSTGCTATARKTFAQGHDAKLKSALIRWGTEGYEIRRDDGGVAVTGDALTMAREFAFADMIVAAIARRGEKARKAAERKEARRLAKEERQAPQEPTAPEEPQTVKAKVGRWEREGVVEGDTFTYADGKGETQTTTTFTLL